MVQNEPTPVAETPDHYGAFPRLSDDQIAALRERDTRQRTQPGDVLYHEGDTSCDFYVILAGTVALVEDYDTEPLTISVHGPRRFLGELGLLTGHAVFLTAVVREPGEVLAVPVVRLRELVSQDSVLGDLILRAYLIRRSTLIGLRSGFRIIGSRFSPDTRRLREFAIRNRLPHRWIDLEADPQADALLRDLGIPPEDTPVVIWRGRQVLRNPSNVELARAVGLPAPGGGEIAADLVVVGAGPAGLAAAVYASSEGLDTVVLDALAAGGQAGTSPRIENYLGFPAGVSGSELAERALLQAEKFGARISVPAEATAFDERDGLFVVRLADTTAVHGRTVVIATGVRYRTLEVPGLDQFEGASVYYAATQMEAQACGGQPVAIVGGGNSAGQAALFLAQHSVLVRLVVREPALGENMSRYLVDQIERHPRIDVLRHTEVRAPVGRDGVLDALIVEDTHTGERRRIPARALFVFVGAQPHTRWLGDQISLDPKGFVRTGPEADDAAFGGAGRPASGRPFLLETSRPGVFAAGDVRSGSVKRVASAVGEGAMAVWMVHEHLPGRAEVTRPVR